MEEHEASVQRISEFSVNIWKEDAVRRNMKNKTVKEQDWSYRPVHYEKDNRLYSIECRCILMSEVFYILCFKLILNSQKLIVQRPNLF